MISKLLNIGHYGFDFFENRKLPEFYNNITNKFDVDNITVTKFIKIPITKKKDIYRVYNIPPYIGLSLENPNAYKTFILPEIDKGLLINLEPYKSIEDYTLKQISSRKRKQLRSSLKRLESCFKITYKTYYGEIDKITYNTLIDKAHNFITRRFNQINKEHIQLKNWSLIKNNTYKLVKEKKASIFVIYDNEKPINICFNYHFKDITSNSLSTYDIDYAKYSLGSIDILKQIEWNINNDFKIFDMSIGESEYKHIWLSLIHI